MEFRLSVAKRKAAGEAMLSILHRFCVEETLCSLVFPSDSRVLTFFFELQPLIRRPWFTGEIQKETSQ